MTLNGQALLSQYETVLQSVTYQNTSDNPSIQTRTIDFVINDGDDSSNLLSRDVQINPMNDPPALSSIEPTSAQYIENSAPIAITGNLAIDDLDDTQIDTATITISGNFASGEDVLSFNPQFGITGNFDTVTGTLTLTGPASLAQYETVLHSVTYVNTSDNPSALTRTIDFVVNDGDDNSNLLSRDIDISPVNDAPVLSNIESIPATYTENDLPLTITSAITPSDLDDTLIQSASVTIGSNFAPGQDNLLFTDQSGIVGVYNPFTGILQLTGSASIADYEAALRSVTYENISDDPSDLTRTLVFVVNDGNVDSNQISREIQFLSLIHI